MNDKTLDDALKTIDIVDKLIHSITRRHIPDYPEATIAINEIDKLIDSYCHKQVIEANTFDNHLRKYLPHDNKWRHVEFDIKIDVDGKLGFESELRKTL